MVHTVKISNIGVHNGRITRCIKFLIPGAVVFDVKSTKISLKFQ